jgi:hypothetical protein
VKIPPFSYPYSLPHTLVPPLFPHWDDMVPFPCNRAAYEVRRFCAAREFPGAFRTSVYWVRRDSRGRVVICNLICNFSCFSQPIPITVDRRTAVNQGVDVVMRRFVKESRSYSIHSLLQQLQRSNPSVPHPQVSGLLLQASISQGTLPPTSLAERALTTRALPPLASNP